MKRMSLFTASLLLLLLVGCGDSTTTTGNGDDVDKEEGEACTSSDECLGGLLCYDDVCQKICLDNADCDTTHQHCENGVCAEGVFTGCGNGILEAGEVCDDGNFRLGDGCNDDCELEERWICNGSPSVCECQSGYQDNDDNGSCNISCSAHFGGLDCGGHGVCDDSNGTAHCTCNPGYQDHDNNGTCLVSCDGLDGGSDCGGHGSCRYVEGRATCTCESGYQDEDLDGMCMPTCDNTTGGIDCGGNGECVLVDGEAMCICDDGYQDNDNDTLCVVGCLGTAGGLYCGGKGLCDDSSGAAECTCDQGFHDADSDGVCTCPAGMQDKDDDGTCTLSCAGREDCGGHGACSDLDGSAECECTEGYQDNDNNLSCRPTCETSTGGLECGGFGSCDDASGEPVCTCDADYQDSNSDTICSIDCLSNLCGHGSCAIVDGEAQCTCDEGYTEDPELNSSRCVCDDGYFNVSGVCYPTCETELNAGTLVCGNNSNGCYNSTDPNSPGVKCSCVVYVDGINGSAAGTGASWVTAYDSIDAAIDKVNNTHFSGGAPSCDIWVAQGTYQMSGKILSSEKPLGIYGGFVGNEIYRGARDPIAHETFLEGNGGRAFDINGATSIHFNGLKFVNGSAVSGAAIIISNSSSLISFENCVFRNNIATDDGGAIQATDSSFDVTGCTFEQNRATDDGGAIFLIRSGTEPMSVSIRDSQFLDNAATNDGARGGALYAQTLEKSHGDILNIQSTLFKGNQAEFGGAIYNYDADPQITFSRFQENIALRYNDTDDNEGFGGAINNYIADPVIEHSTFIGNVAYESSGAIHSSRSSSEQSFPVIRSSVFIANRALGRNGWGPRGGGAVHSTNSCTTIEDSLFVANRADIGATGNSSGDADYQGGGALYLYNRDQNCVERNIVRNCIFSGNYGGNDLGGGAIMINNRDTARESVFIDNSVFVGNWTVGNTSTNSLARGGAIYNIYAHTVIMNSTFSQNVALANTGSSTSGQGGAIYNVGSNPYITNSIMWDNYSSTTEIQGGTTSRVTYSIADGLHELIDTNFYSNPYLMGPRIEVGQWDGTSLAYDDESMTTTLRIAEAGWAEGALAGLFVQPDMMQPPLYYIVNNTSDSLSIYGDATTWGIPLDATYALYDFHLPANSPAIDYGTTTAPRALLVPEEDYDGVGRVCGPLFDGSSMGCPDIGAFEYSLPAF